MSEMTLEEKLEVDEMRRKAIAYSQFQSDFYMNRKSEEDLTQMATQPFWQSVRLTKRRMQKFDITMDEQVTDESYAYVSTNENYRDENHHICSFQRSLKSKKIIYQSGRKIKTEKEPKVCITDVIKVKTEENTAQCSNCGFRGKIASFIDGCDYCGSKYIVEDSEEKISAYSLEENAGRKAFLVFKTIMLGSLAVIGISMLIAFIALVMAIVFDISSANLKAETQATVILMIAIKVISVLFQILFYTLLIFIGVAWAVANVNTGRIVNAYIAENVIPGFQKTVFAENLEYKLRNIHMAEQAREVNVYALCDLTDIVKMYGDVIESAMTKVRFLNVCEEADRYVMDVEVRMRLSRWKGSRIKSENEVIYLQLTLRKGVTDKKISSITEYECPDCGGNINMLEAGICSYCRKQLDYANYSFMILAYERKGTVRDFFYMIRNRLILVYAVLLCMIAGVVCSAQDADSYSLFHMEELFAEAQSIYDSVLALEEIDTTATMTYEEIGYINRVHRYTSADIRQTLELYASYLEGEGFTRTKVREDRIRLSRKIYIDERYGSYHEIYLTIEGDELKVENRLDEVE